MKENRESKVVYLRVSVLLQVVRELGLEHRRPKIIFTRQPLKNKVEGHTGSP